MWSLTVYENRASLMTGYEKLLESISMDEKKTWQVKCLYLMDLE